MVWKSSTKVGFGFQGKFVVARYCNTPGNINGEVRENVFPIGGYKECGDLEMMD